MMKANLTRIEDVLMVCGTCGSTFRLGDCEPKDAYAHEGPYDGENGCPLADCGGTMREFGQ
jgi:hypothetical protein